MSKGRKIDEKKLEEIKKFIASAGLSFDKVLEEILSYVGKYGAYGTIRLRDIVWGDDTRRTIRRILTRCGFKVAFDNYVYVENDEQVKTLLSALIDIGYITREKVLGESPDPLLKGYISPSLNRALFKYPDLLEKLGLTRAHIMMTALKQLGLSRETLLQAGFAETEKEDGWVLEYERKDSDGFVHRIIVAPDGASGYTEKTYSFPRIGEHSICRNIRVLNGETLEEVLERNKKSIAEEAERLNTALRELENFEKSLGVKIRKIEIEGGMLTVYWKYKNLPTREYRVDLSRVTHEMQSLRKEIEVATSSRELTPENKVRALYSLAFDFSVDAFRLAEEIGAGVVPVIKFAKSLGAEYSRGYLYLSDEDLKRAVEKLVDERTLSLADAMKILMHKGMFSEKIYSKLLSEDSLRAAEYKISTIKNFDEIVSEIKRVWEERKAPLPVVELIMLARKHWSIYGEEAEKIGEVFAEVIEAMDEETFEYVFSNYDVPLYGKAEEAYATKLGELTGLGEPTDVVMKTAYWDKGDIMVYVRPERPSPERSVVWAIGAVSKKHTGATYEKTYGGVFSISEEFVEHLRDMVKYAEADVKNREKLYLSAIYSVLKEYGDFIGEEPEAEVRRTRNGLEVRIPNLGTVYITVKAFKIPDGEAQLRRSAFDIPTIFDSPADLEKYLRKELGLEFMEQLQAEKEKKKAFA